MKVKRAFWMLLITFLAILHSHSCNGRTAASEQQLGLGQQPLIQLSHDDSDDDYLDIKDEIHLEDFFWTGSGDGPPDYLKKVHTGISKGKDVIVKTETVVATVYVDGNNEIDIPICLDCRPDDGGGTWDLGAPGMPPLNYSSTDRRYWLLTVVSGFYTAKDNPLLEEKLARLYRLAFTRQQTRHLGINGAQQIEGVLVAAPRERRKSSPLATSTTKPQPPTDSPSDEVEILDMAGDDEPYIKTVRAVGERSEWSSDSEEEMDTETETPATSTSSSTESVDYSAYVTLIPWELIQQNGKSEKLQEAKMEKQQQQQPQQAVPLYRDGRVRVVIHNLTQISEADVQNWSTNTNGDAMEHVNFVNLKFNDRPIANQTELIYTVLVNGRPVLATTAAKDMELVSEVEAVSTFGQAIYMKSEQALAYADYNTSPFHNPSAIRNHYEGLLEGALQMYASQDDIPMPLPTHNFTNSRRAATNREHRGSSAGLPSFYPTAGSRAAAERPATAQPEKTTKLSSTQPPSPTHSAWGGGSMYSSHSTLNRPLSAGHHHREEDLYTEVPKQAATSSASASAAPLIEAIQTELRKFKQRKD
ncbi:uncharacterized protein LOC117898128 isoform X2 [Drosophila subobscura]|uniref:uncharacterized protein LOC117898128 isoform X2 n=1 Tax=Drosophila subobscura TaxID=7241 RepID=UPI00155A77E6|nr:uncharacterized protein LOC117898128 isoform X2 [Drosophila subobscura]